MSTMRQRPHGHATLCVICQYTKRFCPSTCCAGYLCNQVPRAPSIKGVDWSGYPICRHPSNMLAASTSGLRVLLQFCNLFLFSFFWNIMLRDSLWRLVSLFFLFVECVNTSNAPTADIPLRPAPRSIILTMRDGNIPSSFVSG